MRQLSWRRCKLCAVVRDAHALNHEARVPVLLVEVFLKSKYLVGQSRLCSCRLNLCALFETPAVAHGERPHPVPRATNSGFNLVEKSTSDTSKAVPATWRRS